MFLLKKKSLYFQINYILPYQSGGGKEWSQDQKNKVLEKSNDKYLKWRENITQK